jgi:hypothetical protein
VTLTATPASGSVFRWSGACWAAGCNVTMSQARSVSATFTLQSSAPVCLVPKVKGEACRGEERAHASPLQGGQGHQEVLEGEEGARDPQRPKPGTNLPAGEGQPRGRKAGSPSRPTGEADALALAAATARSPRRSPHAAGRVGGGDAEAQPVLASRFVSLYFGASRG